MFSFSVAFVQQSFSFCGSPAGLKGRRGSSDPKAVGLQKNIEEKQEDVVRNLKTGVS